MDRKSILCDLVELRKPLYEILLNLKRLPWDSNATVVMLKQQHLASVLRRYPDKELSDGDVQIGQMLSTSLD